MNTQQTLAGYKTTKDFVNELAQHIKITKICNEPEECYADNDYWAGAIRDCGGTGNMPTMS